MEGKVLIYRRAGRGCLVFCISRIFRQGLKTIKCHRFESDENIARVKD